MIFSILTLLTALALAGVAGWFSIVGIMSIYAGAAIHALVMGVVLECGKLVTTSWLYRNWKFSDWRLKAPLIFFTLTLMLSTSIGVFGFLSKAHLEQNASTIDNSAKVERLEQQIAREKSIIADNEKVIAQLDATINSYIGKDRTDRSVSIRRSQAPQRKQLRDDIDASQKRIDVFSDEKLKLQSEVRALQLEVGPIRYIAELIYGVEEKSDKNIEAAVRMFTLIIVSTLDPLAVILLIAANHTLMRRQNEKKQETTEERHIFQDNHTGQFSTAESADGTPTDEVKQDFQEIKNSRSEIIAAETIHAAEETTLHVSIPPETLVPLNEKEDTIAPSGDQETSDAEQSHEDKIIPSGQDSEILHDDGSTIVQDDIQSETPEPEIVSHTEISPPSQGATLDEKEASVLEKIETVGSVAPLPIIQQPSLSRISYPSVSVQDISETKLETPLQNLKGTPWTSDEHTLRGLVGHTPHFIPKRLNEEEKISKIENKSIADEVSWHAFDGNTEKVREEGMEGEEEVVGTGPIRNTKAIPVNVDKYPKALSWLNEFKRS